VPTQSQMIASELKKNGTFEVPWNRGNQ
jgi:hypothetical protein